MTDRGALLYLDRLTFRSVLHVARRRGRVRHVTLLDAPSGAGRFWQGVLALAGVPCQVADFFAGHLKTGDGESVYFAARRVANHAALAAAAQLVAGPVLGPLNASSSRNTVQLFIARHLARHIEEWVSRILVVRSLETAGGAHLLIRRPRRFPVGVLSEVAPEIHREYYDDPVREWSAFVGDVGMALLRNVWRFTHVRWPVSPHRSAKPMVRPALLVMQEESLRNRNTLRNQLHFIDRDANQAPFETFVLMAPRAALFDNEQPCLLKGVTVLPYESMGRALAEFRRHPCLRRVARDRRRILINLWRVESYSEFYCLIQVWLLLFHAQLLAGTFLKFGIRCFLTKEPRVGDAAQLVAAEVGVTTVALQYSNTPFVSPGMMSTADVFLVFSDAYRAVFESAGIGPGRFVVNGYLYDGVAPFVRSKAREHRRHLEQHGARFVICYFDESVQHDRWGVISTHDHLSELHALARLVVASGDVGVIVKSQFMRNSPSAVYRSDALLAEAVRTGRYLEVREGVHRNDVYPTEVALAADICIGHKFGATAALEAAAAGSRALLIDAHGVVTEWDRVYATSDVVVGDIWQAIAAIEQFRAETGARSSLGNWDGIRAVLAPALPEDALTRTRQVILDSLSREVQH